MNETQARLLVKELIAEWYSEKQPFAKLHNIQKHMEVLKIYFPFQELMNDSSSKYPGLRSMIETLLIGITKYPEDVQAIIMMIADFSLQGQNDENMAIIIREQYEAMSKASVPELTK